MPSVIKPISREYRIYLALWRKAYLNPEPVVIRASNLSMAVAMRQGMYRAIRPFRFGQLTDNELLNAAEKFVLYLVRAENKDDPHFIEIRKRATLEELNETWDDLGIDEEDLLLSDERATNESLKRILDKSKQKPSKDMASTPFYTREE